LHLCISPNSKLLAWVNQYSSICLWDLANGQDIPFLGPPLWSGWDNLAFYPDNDHLAFGTGKGTEIWDTRSARKVSSWGKKEGGVAVSPGGWWLMDADRALWNSQTSSCLFSLPPETGRGPIWSVAITSDGQHLAIGLADGGLAIWNVPMIQAQLAQIGLAWRADAQPPPQPAEGRTPAFRYGP
jgi:WD40 repeat protein